MMLGDALGMCPDSNCQILFTLDLESKFCRHGRCKCGLMVCIKCGIKWSEDHVAQVRAQIKMEQKIDEMFEDNTNNMFSKCPRCNTRIERSGACHHMTHNSCPKPGNIRQDRTDFCIFVAKKFCKGQSMDDICGQ
eukprot:TRINITY_DN378_c0_g2_i1.p1 TRINITY_DN378_c0_g2~~TRINITY_DN378_c0_g2_i1.p1  ORF type:complete len:135 (+),score=17.32 TRINITY_DN378_c0_g2_i1:236-640(+)